MEMIIRGTGRGMSQDNSRKGDRSRSLINRTLSVNLRIITTVVAHKLFSCSRGCPLIAKLWFAFFQEGGDAFSFGFGTEYAAKAFRLELQSFAKGQLVPQVNGP